jgi:N-ethylmaleimide reductase
LDQFIQSCSNQRTDQYGGSIENRARLLEEVFTGITNVFPANRIGVRISPNNAYNGMGSPDNIETFTYVVRMLDRLKASYVHMTVLPESNYEFFSLERLRENFSGFIIACGNFDKEKAEKALNAGVADLIAFGRPWISNPDLPARFQNNWTLNPPASPADMYFPSATGYTDFPFYEDSNLSF